MINYIKKNYKSILFIFIYSIIAYGLYFNAHYVHDSYRIYNFGFWQNLEGFFRQGRIFSMLFNMLFYALKISPRAGQIISLILLIIFLTIATLIVYHIILKRLEKNHKSINNKFLILLICTGLFFNIYITEWMMFFEGCIIALGALLSVLSAYFILEKSGKFKYIFSTIFLVLSVFCYQASMVIGGSLLITLLIYDNRNEKLFSIAKKVIISMIPYIIALLINFAFVKIVNAYNLGDGRLNGGINIFSNLFFVVKQVGWYFIRMFNYPLGYVLFALSIFCMGYYFYIVKSKKQKCIYLLYYIISMFSLWFLSVLPVVAMPTGSQYFVARSIPYMSSVIPYALVCTALFTVNIDINKDKIINFIAVTYSIIVVLSCIKITSECLINNTQDICIAKYIQSSIDEYEAKTGNVIDTIVLVPDSELSPTSKGIKYYGDNSVRALCANFAAKEIMYFVSKRYYNVDLDTIEKKVELFGKKEWDDFSKEQLKFKDNRLYLVNY